MEYARGDAQVIYHGKNQEMPERGMVVYDPLTFLALVLMHVPEPREMRVRYYGAASSTIRRGGRKGTLAERGKAEEVVQEESTYVKARRRTWAQLLARVYGVDALKCDKCGGRMRIISFITDPEVVEKILRHVGVWGEGRVRGPPGRLPGASPGERVVVVNEYSQESPPEDFAVEHYEEWEF
jgi:hypothetical protein